MALDEGALDIDLLARIFSMGVLHHAMTGTGAAGRAVTEAGTRRGSMRVPFLGSRSRAVDGRPGYTRDGKSKPIVGFAAVRWPGLRA